MTINQAYSPRPVLKLTDKQSAQMRGMATVRHYMSVGGGRSGKTFGAVNMLLTRALLAPGSRHLIYRKYARDARQAIMQDTLPSVAKLWANPDSGVRPPEMVMHKQDGFAEVLDPAGGESSEIWFAGLDDSNLDKILGREYASIYGNEASEYTYQTREIVLSRLAQSATMRSGKPLPLLELQDLNPTTTAHWTYKLWMMGVDPASGEPVRNPRDYGHIYMNPIDNAENLPPEVLAIYGSMSEANRKRFLLGQYAADVEGGLWRRNIIRHAAPPEIMDRVVVAIDPAVSTKPGSDETGVIGAGISGPVGSRLVTILDDASGKYQPLQWARVAIDMHDRLNASCIVCERNQGGDMVAQTLRSAGYTGRIEEVTATRGKLARAEPIAALYERGLVRHAFVMPKLEEQMCSMSLDFNAKDAGWSPDRVDALVWAVSALHTQVTAQVASRSASRPQPKRPW